MEALGLDGPAAHFKMIMSFGDPRRADLRGALRGLDRELRRAPGSAPLHAAKGRVLSALSRYPEARLSLGRALALDGSRALTRAWLGEAFLLENSIAKALAQFDRALSDDPACAWASFFRATARYVAGRFDQVEQDLAGVLKPGVEPAVQAAAGAFSSLLEAKAGRYGAAFERIEEVRAKCPGETWPLVLRAALHRGSGDKAAALKDLAAALAAHPSAWIHLERAAVLEELDRPEEALAHVDAAKKLEGPAQEIFLRRARLNAARERYDEALRDFDRAARFGPSEPMRALGIDLIQLLKEASRPGDSRKIMNALCRDFPRDRAVHSLRKAAVLEKRARSRVLPRGRRTEIVVARMRHRAELLIARGRRKEAESVLRSAAREGATDPSVFFELGQLLERRGRRSAAEKAYRRAVALKPSRLQPYFSLAQLFLARGERRAMARVLDAARRDAPREGDSGIERLLDLFQAALCRRDNEEAERIGEEILDRTRRLKDLEVLAVPILPGFDGLALSPAMKKYSMEAVRGAEKYAAAHPGSPWGDYIQILWRARLDPSPQAEALCYGRLAGFPASRYGWMRLKGGCDLLYRGEFRSAIGHLEAARDFSSPPDWRSQCFIAEAHLYRGDTAGALRAFRKAEQFAPADARGEAAAWKGAALLWRGRYRRAIRVLDGIPREARSPYALCWKGAALSKLRRYKPALAALDAAIARFPHDWEARVWRAETLLRSGRAREARREADVVFAHEGERGHYALAVRGLACAALGDETGVRRDLRLLPKPLVRLALSRLGPSAARDADGAKIMEEILESSLGLRRSDVHMARWLSWTEKPKKASPTRREFEAMASLFAHERRPIICNNAASDIPRRTP
jgi:tetratricopeptide (TPR) repeat protein